MIWIWAVLGGALGVIWIWRVLAAVLGIRRVPALGSPAFDRWPERDGQVPSVCMVVPARNEAEFVEAAMRSMLAIDYPRLRIVAIDDRSTDATGEILDRLAAEAGGLLQVVHVTELPAGWLGKTHAMWLAAQPATEDWLLFTDADVHYRPDALRRALAFAEDSNGDHLAVFPRVKTRSLAGHALVAFFGMLFLFWHCPWKVSDPDAPDYVGLGAFNLIRRRAYERIGTWEALRLAILDDMKLGEAVKRHRLPQRAATGLDLISVSWVQDGRDLVRNLTKNFFAVTRYRWSLALGICLGLLLFQVVPFVAVFLAPGWTKAGYAVALCTVAGVYVHMSRQSQTSPLLFFLHPLSALVFVFTLLRSTILTIKQGGVIWRGTKYPLSELRRQ